MKNQKQTVIWTSIGDGYVRLDLASGRILILARPSSNPRSAVAANCVRNPLEEKAREFRIQMTG